MGITEVMVSVILAALVAGGAAYFYLRRHTQIKHG